MPTRVCRKETVLDLFAGCGGLALGFEVAGFETTGFEKLPTPAKHTTRICLASAGICSWSRTKIWLRRPT